MKRKLSLKLTKLLLIVTILFLIGGCQDHVKPTSIYISILTDPKEATVYYSVSSKLDKVKKIKRTLLGKSPYRSAMMLDVDGLSQANAHQVVLTFEIFKKGYYKKTEKIDFRQILGIREVRLKYHLTENKGTGDGDSEEGNPFTIPLAPEKVSASNGSYKDYVEVSWTKVEDAEKYYIYRDSKSDGDFNEKLALIKGVKYIDSTAKPGQVYYYKVQAYNKIGSSKLSEAAQGYRKKSAKDDKDSDNSKGSNSPGSPLGEVGVPNPKTGGVGAPGGIPSMLPKAGKGIKGIFKNISG